jgi:preprotein translocase subunit SecB
MNPIAQLQLRDYVLLYLLIEANPNFKPAENKGHEGDIGFNFDFRKNPEEPIFLVDMEILLNQKEEMFKQQPYRIQIRVQTFIEFDKSFPEKDIPNLLGPNGLAMTYSIARGIVGQATGTSLHGKFMLPTMNFIEVLKEQQKKTTQKSIAVASSTKGKK